MSPALRPPCRTRSLLSPVSSRPPRGRSGRLRWRDGEGAPSSWSHRHAVAPHCARAPRRLDSTAGGGVGARRGAMGRGTRHCRGDACAFERAARGLLGRAWGGQPAGDRRPRARTPLGGTSPMASFLVAARTRATGGRPASVGPGAPVLRTPTLDPTTRTPGRDGSARSPPARVRGKPSRRPCGRRGGFVSSRVASPFGGGRVDASQRLHLEREAERESRSEASRTGATPVLPPVREREAERDELPFGAIDARL